jgi:hypothetical protein
MRLHWKISAADVRRLRAFVKEHRRNSLVRRRIDKNIRGNRPPVTPTRFWHGLALGLLTTQQRSGPGSRVNTLLSAVPFPISHKRCKEARSPRRFIASTLRKHGGIRRIDTISEQLSAALSHLRAGGWQETRAAISKLPSRRGVPAEREAANFLISQYSGLGPKQSRNVLQFLGLTRYEIPLDSRLVKWLNEFGFPVRLSVAGLSDPAYYEFIEDGVQQLCRATGIYPCVFDAIVFSSFDTQPWSDDNLIG